MLVPQVHKGPTEPQGLKDQQGLGARLEHKVLKEWLERPVHRDPKVVRDR